MANTMMMLVWKETALVTPVALLNALMDPPMPKISKLTEAFGSICLLDTSSVNNLESGSIPAHIQSLIGTLPDAQTAAC